jgi:hypothetical protein
VETAREINFISCLENVNKMQNYSDFNDIRGELRMAIERSGDGFDVTEYSTNLSEERIMDIY